MQKLEAPSSRFLGIRTEKLGNQCAELRVPFAALLAVTARVVVMSLFEAGILIHRLPVFVAASCVTPCLT